MIVRTLFSVVQKVLSIFSTLHCSVNISALQCFLPSNIYVKRAPIGVLDIQKIYFNGIFYVYFRIF